MKVWVSSGRRNRGSGCSRLGYGISPLGSGHHSPHHKADRIYTGRGKQTLGWHKQKLVLTRTQETGAVITQETDPDFPWAKMGTIKDGSGMNLNEAEDIKKRWKEYTEELYRKDLHDPDNHDGVIIHLEPGILEYQVKWAL